jgi:hypothetical protein
MTERTKLQPDMFRGSIEANTESPSLAVIASDNSLAFKGTFRRKGDEVAMVWDVDQIHSSLFNPHPKMKTPGFSDFRNVRLTYIFSSSNCKAIDNGTEIPQIVVEAYDSSGSLTEYAVRAHNYATDEGGGNWRVVLDFGNLRYGWSPAGSFVPADKVVRIKFFCVPSTYIESSTDTVGAGGEEFYQNYANWTVEGSLALDAPRYAGLKMTLGMVVDYDAVYTLTPKLVVQDLQRMGFDDKIILYVGTNYFNREIDAAELTGYYLDHDATYKCHYGARSWIADFLTRAADLDIEAIIAVSFEVAHPEGDWVQRTTSGTYAQNAAGAYVLDPHVTQLRSWYEALYLELADLMDGGGQDVSMLYYRWMWYRMNEAPCFYRAATVSDFTAEEQYSPPNYTTCYQESYDAVWIGWLRNKIGTLEVSIRNAIRQSYYGDAEFGAWEDSAFVGDAPGVRTGNSIFDVVNRPSTKWQEMDYHAASAFMWTQLGEWDKLQAAMDYPVDSLGFSRSNTYWICGAMDPTMTYEQWYDADLLPVYTEDDQPFLVDLGVADLPLQRGRSLSELNRAIAKGFGLTAYWSITQYHHHALTFQRFGSTMRDTTLRVAEYPHKGTP